MGLKKLVALSCVLLTLVLLRAGVARADNFSNGEFATYTGGAWSSGGVAAPLLVADFNSVYQGTDGDLIVGVTGTPGQYFLELDSAGAVLGLLPTSGQAGALTSNLLDPTTTSSGVFATEVIAIALNVDFSNAGLLGNSSTPFGDLVLANFVGVPNAVNSLTGLNGLTVNQFLATANTCLGAGSCPLGIENTDAIAQDLELSFYGGTPSAFAEDHLELPSSTTPAPEPSSLLLLAPALAGLGLLRSLLKA
jgi:hypothetical protein